MSALETNQPPPAESPAKRGPFAVGEKLAGVYRIERVLGVGGMGAVYEAADENLPRRVAIKAPLFAVHAQALRNEAQALSAVSHRSFPIVHHFGSHDGVDFLVMERIFGDTLEDRLDELRSRGQRLAIEEVVNILFAMTDALAAAHRAGIAHRDLKPSNVLMAGERLVLLDLGLFVPEVLVSPDNVPAGSVYTVAPEVLTRDVAQGNGPLVDLYALGAVAFQLLTGVPPYDGDSIQAIFASHVSAAIPDPSALRPDVPHALAALVRELLAKRPADRPPNAEAVLWQLAEMRGRVLPGGRRMSVLVVDDDALVGKAVARSLEDHFPQLGVAVTTDPTRALPRDGRSVADVVVVDVNMPGTNGIEICMALCELPEALRPTVIAMSGSAAPRDVAVLRALGVDRYVPKDAALLAAVGDAIGHLRSGPPSSRPAPSRPPPHPRTGSL